MLKDCNYQCWIVSKRNIIPLELETFFYNALNGIVLSFCQMVCHKSHYRLPWKSHLECSAQTDRTWLSYLAFGIERRLPLVFLLDTFQSATLSIFFSPLMGSETMDWMVQVFVVQMDLRMNFECLCCCFELPSRPDSSGNQKMDKNWIISKNLHDPSVQIVMIHP